MVEIGECLGQTDVGAGKIVGTGGWWGRVFVWDGRVFETYGWLEQADSWVRKIVGTNR